MVTLKISDAELASLRACLDYLLEVEKRHFEECEFEDGDCSNHIYAVAKKSFSAINKTKNT